MPHGAHEKAPPWRGRFVSAHALGCAVRFLSPSTRNLEVRCARPPVRPELQSQRGFSGRTPEEIAEDQALEDEITQALFQRSFEKPNRIHIETTRNFNKL